jgi:hypothetical protein
MTDDPLSPAASTTMRQPPVVHSTAQGRLRHPTRPDPRIQHGAGRHPGAEALAQDVGHLTGLPGRLSHLFAFGGALARCCGHLAKLLSVRQE